jgi:hypothetical protein
MSLTARLIASEFLTARLMARYQTGVKLSELSPRDQERLQSRLRIRRERREARIARRRRTSR